VDILTPLQKAQGKIVPKGNQRDCPIHHTNGRVTDWKPPSGLGPLLREFKCYINGHAFYEIVRHRKDKHAGEA